MPVLEAGRKRVGGGDGEVGVEPRTQRDQADQEIITQICNRNQISI